MNWINYVVVAVIALIVGGAAFYILRAKRRGQKCIGCPDSKHCAGCCGCCEPENE